MKNNEIKHILKRGAITMIAGVMITASGLILEGAPVHASERGSWVQEGSNWKYQENGEFVEDWKQIDGDWYYFDAMNMMVTGLAPIRNENNLFVAHQFDDNGKWLGEYKNTNTVQETKKPKDLVQLSENEFCNEMRKEMFRLINEHRENNGVEKLEWSDELMESAKWKSQHMSDNNYFAHNWKGMRSRDFIMQELGITIHAENITKSPGIGNSRSAGTAKIYAESDFNAWKNSTGHNQNMLNPALTKFGYGIVISNGEEYATQQFAF